ncbi:MAG TPA: response regulator [Roseimicrobium sp.]|nr:response regulator [Roseimicrobium sp.]
MSTKRILIIDDEVSFTRIMRMNLEKTGLYEVREENRATHAIKAAREFKPDLICLDVIMPAMEGGDVASYFMKDPELRKIPIIFITATVSKREAAKSGLNSGGFVFLAKPVTTETLLETIADHLNRPYVPPSTSPPPEPNAPPKVAY